MTPYETASIAASHIGLAIAAGNMLAAIIAAVGIWVFGSAMRAQNKERAAQTAEDRKVTQGMLAALERQGAALEKLINRTDAVVVELQRHQGPGGRQRRRA